MSIIKVYASEQRVRSAIQEFKSDVSGNVPEQAVVAHSESIFGVVAPWIPSVDRRHSAGVRRHKGGNGKHTMAVFAASPGEGREHGVAEPRKHAPTFASVIQSVFSEGTGESIAGGRSYRGDAEVGCESLAVSRRPLPPLWRRVIRLVNTGRDCSTHNRIGPERIEKVAVKLYFRCRGM